MERDAGAGGVMRGAPGDDGKAGGEGGSEAVGAVAESRGAAPGCVAGIDATDADDEAGGGGCAIVEDGSAGAAPGVAVDRTRATMRRNAARRSCSFSATSASARHTHGLLGCCVARARNNIRARRMSPC